MSQTTIARNPFMLMLNPEVVLAAVEKSERLSQLNRHLCRPLDRPVLGTTGKPAEAAAEDSETDDAEGESI
ncbi:MAG: hypothetical protein U1F50_09460 [Rubrivivax sp.]